MVSEASQDYEYEEDEEKQEKEDRESEFKEWEFPQILGKVPEYKNGVLEFIKVFRIRKLLFI